MIFDLGILTIVIGIVIFDLGTLTIDRGIVIFDLGIAQLQQPINPSQQSVVVWDHSTQRSLQISSFHFTTETF